MTREVSPFDRVAMAVIVTWLMIASSCDRRRPPEPRSTPQDLVAALYGPTFLLVLDDRTGRPTGEYCFVTYGVSAAQDLRTWSAAQLEAQEPIKRLVEMGPGSLPYLFGAMLDDRAIPSEDVVGYFHPDDIAATGVRVSDRAAAAFSLITGVDARFVRRGTDGVLRRTSPDERLRVLRDAYEKVLAHVQVE